jgi:anti-sigma regulatory factor (Ser/Thr protein kinase)
VLAVNEAVSNTISHTSGPGRLRIWRDAATLVCEICDRGHIADPLAGRHPAPAVSDGGHGLRVVN